MRNRQQIWTIFWHSAFRYMKVDVVLFKIRRLFFYDGAHITQCDPRRFLHDIAKLSGKDQISFSRHNIHFYLQRIAAYLCPGKTTYDTDLVFCICHIRTEFLFTKKSFNIFAGNSYFFTHTCFSSTSSHESIHTKLNVPHRTNKRTIS